MEQFYNLFPNSIPATIASIGNGWFRIVITGTGLGTDSIYLQANNFIRQTILHIQEMAQIISNIPACLYIKQWRNYSINNSMPRLSLWGGPKKQNDYKFVDRQISEFISASGTATYVHLNIGTYPATPKQHQLLQLHQQASTPLQIRQQGTDDQNPLSSTYLYDYKICPTLHMPATISTEGYGYGNETIKKNSTKRSVGNLSCRDKTRGCVFSSVNDPSIVLTGSGTGTTATPSGTLAHSKSNNQHKCYQ